MTGDTRLTDDRIEAMLRRRSREPHPTLLRDILTATAGVPRQRRWGLPLVSRRTMVVAATAMLAATLLGGSLATGGLRGLLGPDPDPAPARPTWLGAVRPDVATLPTILMSHERDGWYAAEDPADAPDDIDLRIIRTLPQRDWSLEIAGLPPTDGTLDATGRAIDYGVVLDAGTDGTADCSIGLSSDAGETAGYRVWVTDLRSGETKEQVGSPYGFPIDFSHPNEQDDPPYDMRFFFLAGSAPCKLPLRDVAFYAWATTSVDGVVQDWDYAPDNGWLLPEVDR